MTNSRPARILLCLVALAVVVLPTLPSVPPAYPKEPGKFPSQQEAAVIRAVNWLVAHQSGDGSWDGDGFMNDCKSCRGAASQKAADPGVTGLSVLALLTAGTQPGQDTPAATCMDKAVTYLLSIQDDGGFYGKDQGTMEFMYGHFIATAALLKYYRLAPGDKLKQSLQESVKAIRGAQNVSAQDAKLTGWRYKRNDTDSDTSVTSWGATALYLADRTGFEVPDKTFDGVRNWLDAMTDEKTLRTGYNSKGGGSSLPSEQRSRFAPSLSGEAISILNRLMLSDKPSKKLIKEQVKLLSADVIDKDLTDEQNCDFYYWYYATYALRATGGSAWKDWKKKIVSHLIAIQASSEDGHEFGSWDPSMSKWGARGGRVYATAICCLTLCAEDNDYLDLKKLPRIE